MTIHLEISPETEESLGARARERGVTLSDYLREIVTREAGLRQPEAKADNLSDLLLNSPFAGANLNLERSMDYPRPAEFE